MEIGHIFGECLFSCYAFRSRNKIWSNSFSDSVDAFRKYQRQSEQVRFEDPGRFDEGELDDMTVRIYLEHKINRKDAAWWDILLIQH